MNSQSVAVISKADPKTGPSGKKRLSKPPHRPLTSVELRSLEDGDAEVVVGFRRPVRRVLREGFDEQFAMTPAEALNLYNRLGRAIALERRRWQAGRQSGGHVE
ncbi:hypothetical protein [Methylobacterium planeticum]|uniref:Uncharacterized protein n=1 Tax=Methylobacterium planeticum TaxID=2615211 RepID=A0A6N6MJ39_9HYPH|nr:hypothetical protein [Methylobacterium planeticum]KAB1068833.1 hypothetical protein F6X51_26325 [Methylobacterium planeticum]